MPNLVPPGNNEREADLKFVKTVLVLVILLVSNLGLSAAIPAAERQALIDLYNSTNGASWTTKTNWLGAAGTENTWFGVTTDAGNTTVLALQLTDNNLVGTLPTSLGNLGNLQHLWLDYNQLTGGIPTELGNLGNLQGLVLSDNQLTGSIPSSLGNLSNLEFLHICTNQLTGGIPTELGNLSNLGSLWLDENQLTGSIPSSLGKLSKLGYLLLYSNHLTGNIPTELGNLSNLTELWLYSNQLTGSIPTSLTNLTSLTYTNIGYNALHTSDAALITFLNSKDPNWASTQTIAPPNVSAIFGSASITVFWTPITYTGDTGGYRVFYATVGGGPYTFYAQTADKSVSSQVVTGLTPGIPYYFVVQTHTDINGNNLNAVDSENSDEALAKPANVDFNGDGQADILWRYYGPGGLNVVWEMGTGSNPAPAIGSQAKDNGAMNLVGGQGPERIYWSPLEAGDLLPKRPARSYRSAMEVGEKREITAVYKAPWEIWGKGKGTKVLSSPMVGTAVPQTAPSIVTSVPLYPVADTNWDIAGVGDFNWDGKPDILWRNYGTPGWTGTNLIWYMNGTTIAGQDLLYTVTDPNWRIEGVGDFNGDGKPDIVWRNYGTAGWTGTNLVWYMNGAAIIGQDVLYTVTNPYWKLVGVGDFNGDGKPDILWRDYGTSGMNVVWYMNGAAIAGQDVLYTVADLNWRIEGVGDYNGDGKPDILWRNYGSGGWTGTNLVWYMNGATIAGQDLLYPVTDLNWRIVIH